MPLGGIAAVATFADQQGKGFAGKLLKESIRRMRESKVPVSTLYPFSHKFYRRYGWGQSCLTQQFLDLRPELFTRFEEHKLVARFDRERDFKDMIACHNEVMARYNLCFSRSDKEWEEQFKDYPKVNAFLYIIRDGSAFLGWFACKNTRRESGGGYVSATDRLALKNETAFKAMLGFFAGLPSNVKAVSTRLPIDADLLEYMDEPPAARINPEQQFRIIDLSLAVKSRGYRPDAKGKLIIKIRDEIADWNAGTWRIDAEDGVATKIEKSSEKAMVEADIGEFSQIFCGYKSAAEPAFQSKLKIVAPAAVNVMDSFFHDRPTYTQDWY
jgi:predicted acetyltransferase